jgi:Transposase DDE domain
MTRDSLVNSDWLSLVERLGGAKHLETSARTTKALVRSRVVQTATDLLRIILAYCLGDRGLRSTAVWASAIGLLDISNVGLLCRLRQCGDWLALLVGQALAAAGPTVSRGRMIRIIDATAVPQAGAVASVSNKLWRIHSAFELPSERFGCFELTDGSEGERLDRIPVVKGEIRLADRIYLKPEQVAPVLDAGADIVVRAGWKSARWLDAHGQAVNLPAVLREAASRGLIDRPIWLARKSQPPLALRMVAVKKPEQAAASARRKARRQAQRDGCQVSKASLVAADWVILVTSLDLKAFAAADVLALYRLRWRIELAFQTLEKCRWLETATRHRPTLRQALLAGTPSRHSVTRAAR